MPSPRRVVLKRDAIKEVAGWLHDGRVERNAWQFRDKEHEFELSVWTSSSEQVRSRAVFWGLVLRTMAVTKQRLVIANVDACRVELKDERVPYFSFETLRYDPPTLEIVTHYCLTIRLTVSGLSGFVEDTGERHPTLLERRLSFGRR